MAAQQFHPDFLRDFTCRRGSCRNSCCRDWEIRLTRDEFHSNRSYRFGPEAYALAKENLRRNPKRSCNEDYALCEMRADGYCTLLTEERLCAWKKTTGKGLCAACDDFPETFIAFLDDEYVFPALSCEAVLELLLDHPDPIRMNSESDFNPRSHFHARIEKTNFARRPLLELYPKLRDWGLAILQDRRFSLDDRMVLLANAMCLVDWMEKNSRVDELPASMEKFLDSENLRRVLGQYDARAIGPQALLAVNGFCLLQLMQSPRCESICRRILNGLGIALTETDEDGSVHYGLGLIDTETYLQRKNALAEFTMKKLVFMEHVLVCEYLRSMVPVTEPCVWDSLRLFNVGYALLKGSIYGSFASPPQDEEMVDAVAASYRVFVHNYAGRDESLRRLNAMQLTDVASMVALAKG